MTLLSLALVLLSASLHVAWNAIAKSSRDPVLFLGLKGIWLLGLGGLLLVGMPLSALPPRVWEMVLYSGVIHAFYALALGRAYRSGDISYVYPIARSAPALIPFAAFLVLDEQLDAHGALGIGLVVAGVLRMQTAGLPGGWRAVLEGLRRPADRAAQLRGGRATVERAPRAADRLVGVPRSAGASAAAASQPDRGGRGTGRGLAPRPTGRAPRGPRRAAAQS